MAKKPNGREPAPPADHNGPPTEAQIVQNRKDRLAALTAQHREIDNKMDVQKARVDEKLERLDIEREKLRELASTRAQVRTAIQHLAPGGYPMDVFDRSYTDLRLKTPHADIEQRLMYQREINEVHGHPFAQLMLPIEPAIDGAQWRTFGYQDGLMGQPCNAAAAGCSDTVTVAAYTAGWNDGQAAIGRGLDSLKAEVTSPPPEGEIPGAPDWREWPVHNRSWNEEQRERFADWYETIPQGEVPTIAHAGAAAEFARLDQLERDYEVAEDSQL